MSTLRHCALVSPLTLSPAQRHGPYQNGLIKDLICDDLFVSNNQLALAEHTGPLFKPMPITVIAFMATAVRCAIHLQSFVIMDLLSSPQIECALHNWADGAQVKAAVHFSTDTWAPVYRRHLKDLTTLESKKKDKIDHLRLKIWEDCW